MNLSAACSGVSCGSCFPRIATSCGELDPERLNFSPKPLFLKGA